jgi:hypothetical protein
MEYLLFIVFVLIAIIFYASICKKKDNFDDGDINRSDDLPVRICKSSKCKTKEIFHDFSEQPSGQSGLCTNICYPFK